MMRILVSWVLSEVPLYFGKNKGCKGLEWVPCQFGRESVRFHDCLAGLILL